MGDTFHIYSVYNIRKPFDQGSFLFLSAGNFKLRGWFAAAGALSSFVDTTLRTL